MTGSLRALACLFFLYSAAACSSSPGQLPSDAPHVVARSPGPGARNVFIGDPIQVTFDRPVAASATSDAAVVMTGQGGATLGKLLTLSVDRKTLTITPVSSPAVPTTLTISLSTTSITSDSGLGLVAPADAWSFEVPAWQEPGGVALNAAPEPWGESAWWTVPAPAMAMDAAGSPVVTYVDAAVSGGTTSYKLLAKRWSGTAWEPLGGPLNLATARPAAWPSLQAGKGSDLFVAWCEQVGDTSPVWTVFVKRWNGTAWTLLGSGLNKAAAEGSYVPSLTVDGQGLPWVAWQESKAGALPADPAVDQVYLKQWVGSLDGGGWSTVGGSANVDPAELAQWPSLVLDPSGVPLLAYATLASAGGTSTAMAVFARKWNGATWDTLGTGAVSGTPTYGVSSQYPRLALDGNGDASLTWWDNASSGTNLLFHSRVRRWSTGSASWIAVGDEVPATSGSQAGSPALAFDGTAAIVADDENFGGTFWQVSVRRWSGTGWDLLGTVLNHDAGVPAFHPSVAVDGHGRPWVAWQEGSPSGRTFDVHVKRLNRL